MMAHGAINSLRAWGSAFLIRSLRQESRFVTHHLIRAGAALLILLMLLSRAATSSMGGGAGSDFARTVMYCCYGFVTLLGGIYFCAAIVEEKEEQTLPLLRLTGASPLAILIGKSTPRLISVLLLLLVATPFLMLSITLGGVALRGLLTAILGLFVYAFMFCQLGLFASVTSRNFQDAFGRTLMLWAFLEFLPLWCWLASLGTIRLSQHSTTAAARGFLVNASLLSSQWWEYLLCWTHVELRWLRAVTEEFPLYRNLSMYLADFGREPIWRPQMTAHMAIAAGFLLMSRILFEPMTAKVVAEGFNSPGRFTRSTRKPRRVHGGALAWKSWRWLSGGWTWLVIRIVGFPLAVAAIAYSIAWGLGATMQMPVLIGAFAVAGTVTFIGHFAILLDRLFHTEIQQKTLSSLLLLPISRNSLLRQMALGLVPAMVASLSCIVCALLLWLRLDPPVYNVIKRAITSAWTYELVLVLVTTMYFGLFLSVRLRHAGMLLAIVLLWFLGPLVASSLYSIASFFVSRQTLNGSFKTVVPVALLIIKVPLCIWMHRLLMRSLDRAGAES